MGRETQGSPAGEKKLERYGVWVKVEPREVEETSESESSFELSDLESSRGAASSEPAGDGTLTVEEEKLLDELDTELGPSESASDLSIPEEEPLLADEEELPDISAGAESSRAAASDEELPELEIEDEPARPQGRRGRAAEAGEVEVPLSESTSQERFEDLDALEDELATAASASREPRGASSEILARIEDELRSIRADLTQLRGELTGLRKAGGEAAVESPRAGSEAQTGFFDEDEDETIALTGDELDNILNTAEITEESAEAPSVEGPELGLEGLDDEAEMPASDVLSLDTPLAEEEINAAAGPAEAAEELPAELELEDLSAEASAAPAQDLEGLPELDLEGVPEIDSAPEAAGEAGLGKDLETLELEEATSDLEALPDASSDLELAEEPAAQSAAPEELGGDVDLVTLAAEAEALEGEAAATPVEDLELGELESVSEEPSAATDAEEIEIELDSAGGAQTGKSAEEGLLEPVEDLEVAEEAPGAAAPSAPAREGTGAIPEDLKDEIRTVLRYMDHLLEALPDEKIQEFANSEYFVTYKKLFEDLGLGE